MGKFRDKDGNSIGESFRKRELARMLAKRTGYRIQDIELILSETFRLIIDILCSGNSVHVSGIKFTNKVVKYKGFYSKLFDRQIPERYKVYPVALFGTKIKERFKKINDTLSRNKDWVMEKQDMKGGYKAWLERKENSEDDG